MSIRFFIALLLLSCLFIQCKSTKRVATNRTAVTADLLKDRLIRNQMKADWFSANAKIGVDGGGFAQSASASIRIRKDSVIWVSVKKLGFEVARALITQDSVYLIDRFNRQYMSNGLDFLSEEYQLPASFESLQAVLLGNPLFFSSNQLSFSDNENYYELTTSGSRKGIYKIDKMNFRMREMQLIDVQEAANLTVFLTDYQTLADDQPFSYVRQLKADSRQSGEVNIELAYQNVEINVPKSIRFEIPARYEKVED